MKRHVNIPVFIPHLGCPNQCVFCNQHTISGVSEFAPDSVRDIIEQALATVDDDCEAEIAFFGGSFTGIDEDLMIKLLDTAYSYVKAGKVTSIRCSTRPDYIDENKLDILAKYGVKVIELGLQSSSDKVLSACKRGHTFFDERRAAKLIVDRGFELVGQMMVGLPGSTLDSEIATADFIILSGAKAARIYPTVVFRDTELCDMTLRGEYTPITNEIAAYRSGILIQKFQQAGVKVIRVGLCSSENLTSFDTYFAGPNHSAMGELAENEIYYVKIREALLNVSLENINSVTVFVPVGAVSKAVGQRKKNKLRLCEEFGIPRLMFSEKKELSEYEVLISAEGR